MAKKRQKYTKLHAKIKNMTKYILHGGRARVDNKLNRSFFQEIAKGVPDGGEILFVYFVYEGDPKPHFEQQKKWLSENADGKKFNFVFADQEKFIDQLKAANAVYFHGGDVAKLLEIVKSIPNFEKILEGKTIAGSSAGAYIFTTYFTPSDDGKIREGLGTLPVKLVCHYMSSDFNSREESARKLKEECPPELELLLLGDYEWKVFEK